MTERMPIHLERPGRLARLVAARAMFPALLIICASGCTAAPRNFTAVRAYYQYDFTTARESLRADAMLRNDEQVILNNTRLGMAALADGDLREAETALGRSFEYLSTAGLNKDRTVAAVLMHEGVRIWKGEPFEQALTYHYVATLYALLGDWENARAAAANGLFRLADFGADRAATYAPPPRTSAQPQDRGYTAVDTNFALGFLMQALASDLSGAPGSDEQLKAALKINPALRPIIDALAARHFDTILLVDYGKGPTKVAYGPDNSLSRFVPQERHQGQLVVMSAGQELANLPAACNVDAMAADHRWNNLESVRRVKSVIGDVMVFGGAIAATHGANRRDEGVALAGLGAIAAGLLAKSGAQADTRYCEFMPQSIYIAPLRLGEVGQRADLRIQVQGDPGSLVILDDVQPGSHASPRVIYLRLHGQDSPHPAWLTRRQPHYSNDFTGVASGPGGFPWILGGRDVSTPTSATLRAYQANGWLKDLTLDDLQELYQAEGILLGSGMEARPGMRSPSFRHVLEAGCGLFTPYPHSIGYKRLMGVARPAYSPKSPAARNAAATLRVDPAAGIAVSRSDNLSKEVAR